MGMSLLNNGTGKFLKACGRLFLLPFECCVLIENSQSTPQSKQLLPSQTIGQLYEVFFLSVLVLRMGFVFEVI